MGRKEELRKRMEAYYASLRGSIPPPPEYLDLKGKTGKWKKGGFRISGAVRAFIIISIIFQAFFPIVVSQTFWALLIIAIIIVVLLAILLYLTGGVSALTGGIPAAPQLGSGPSMATQAIVAIVLILLTLGIVQQFNCGKSTCFESISRKYGTLTASVIFLGLIFFGLVAIAWPLDGGAFIAGALIFGFIVLFAMPFVFNPKAYYSVCSQIPYISGTMICNPRRITIDALKTVKIPVTGGINLRFGTEETDYQPASTLYAGEPYEYTFTLTNYYEEPITFSISPSIYSSYGSGLEFIQPFNQRIPSLKPKEFYQDSASMDPNQMTVKEEYGCPYSIEQINITQKIPVSEIECARGKPCEDPKSGCVKIESFECECVDWTRATCSKETVKARVDVTHSGFFRGNSSLFYSDKLVSASPGFELMQGPLSVVVEFQPNPYISTIHQYRKDVSMYVTFKNRGGDMVIKSIEVIPQNLVVHTENRATGIELIEEVGTQVLSERDINEILPGGELVSGAEVGGKLFTLSPPVIKTTVKNIETNEILDANGVTYDSITYYCNKVEPANTVNNTTGFAFWSTNWDKIYNTIEDSGMCELLRKGNTTAEKQTVEKSMSSTQVILEIRYERKAIFLSNGITPYTRTDECIELEQSMSS